MHGTAPSGCVLGWHCYGRVAWILGGTGTPGVSMRCEVAWGFLNSRHVCACVCACVCMCACVCVLVVVGSEHGE